jgi:hypothetical protein
MAGGVAQGVDPEFKPQHHKKKKKKKVIMELKNSCHLVMSGHPNVTATCINHIFMMCIFSTVYKN